MTDITIPADTAREWAAFIRNNAGGGRLAGLDDLADLLDPPAPSLRDEVADAITSRTGYGDKDDPWNKELAGTILAVVRRHVERLHPYYDPAMVPEAGYVRRDDALGLFGDNGE